MISAYLHLPLCGEHFITTNLAPPPNSRFVERCRGELIVWVGPLHVIYTPRGWTPDNSKGNATDEAAPINDAGPHQHVGGNP
jgi:hypothetical protein